MKAFHCIHSYDNHNNISCSHFKKLLNEKPNISSLECLSLMCPYVYAPFSYLSGMVSWHVK